MRYVYVVTRHVKDSRPSVSHIPNLGLSSSRKTGVKHFNSVLKSRKDAGYEMHWDHADYTSYPGERYDLLRQAFVSKDGEYETLRLERWRV